ncbi:MAG: serine/threonine protein kinase [Myxococcaceae bacterium]|nr:serine/threonine protein kinase [Myxococcaceae bacterium]
MAFDGRLLERSSRYVLSTPIAEGGMASVHLARLVAEEGFARTVAVKRLHATYARDPHFVQMFLDEARIAARIQHPNIVDTLDVVAGDGELFVVMDYVHGESLATLLAAGSQQKTRLAPAVVSAIVCGALRGLHAAHEATNEKGEKLELIHRDVSPQNVFVGVDGFARVIDFGVAKALGRMQSTRDGEVKGKLSYMAPEQMLAQRIDRRADVFSAAVVLWEGLTGRRLFQADDSLGTMGLVMQSTIKPPSSVSPEISAALDAVVVRGLQRDAGKRFQTALEMANALEAAQPSAPPHEVGAAVQGLAAEALSTRAGLIRSLEDSAIATTPPPTRLASAPRHLGVTEISVPGAVISPPQPPRPRWPLVAGALALALVAFFAGNLLRPDGAPPEPVVQTPPEPVVQTPPPPEPTPAPVLTTPEPTPPQVTAAAALPPPPPPPAVTPPPTRPAAKKARDCANPFRIDAKGIKRPRPECFD